MRCFLPIEHFFSYHMQRQSQTFVDVEARECIERVSDKEDEEGMKGNRSSYGAFMHGSILICVSNFML